MVDFDTIALEIVLAFAPAQTTQDRAKLQVAIIGSLKGARDAALEEAAAVAEKRADEYLGAVNRHAGKPQGVSFAASLGAALSIAWYIRDLKGGS